MRAIQRQYKKKRWEVHIDNIRQLVTVVVRVQNFPPFRCLPFPEVYIHIPCCWVVAKDRLLLFYFLLCVLLSWSVVFSYYFA